KIQTCAPNYKQISRNESTTLYTAHLCKNHIVSHLADSINRHRSSSRHNQRRKQKNTSIYRTCILLITRGCIENRYTLFTKKHSKSEKIIKFAPITKTIPN
ncbi:MAG: hypothetical protein PUE54_06655, partial [Bacteroidales bacterium]|nr:hypothetical protein [Bacteroidales bacterium]